MATTPDYAILSAPRISAAGFAAVLAGGHSPAAAEAAGCYAAFTAAGVDPTVGLAVFRKESSFGTAGRAVRNKSWGNIRGGTGYPTDSGHFRIYPSWTVGAMDAARLLGVYGRNAIRPGTRTDSVQTFPYVWAPSSDGNAPDAYGDSLASWIGQWAAKYPSGGGAGPITGPSGGGTVISASAPAATDTKDVPFGHVFRDIFKTVAGYKVDDALLKSWAQYIVESYPEFSAYTGIPPLDQIFGGQSDPNGFNADVNARLIAAAQPYIGQTIEQVPYTIPVVLPSQKSGDPVAELVNGLAAIASSAVVLIVLVALVVLGLYLTVKEG